jgi:hypothetical protein
MTPNQIVKSAYHFFAAVLLLFVAFRVKNLQYILKGLLIFVSVFHMYDVWWFLNDDGNAPI